ncbi:MAG: tRNA (guanosine(37)-N1)-methyltransferase TrmD [Chloroflexota bacterium]|nr:tRNA (guanosine(37)-N1)-methyltransferase TrmD [Chloroflexota bacterium]MCY3581826.1 tRNA (guanosine(37)-N1)-methyltransferase TrmD [Chloroflexota bacterium]MDE2650734.1 tRNA (guanosine(37)-N1)-methyltransferase TrmD [Chloroflexota bacterium]MXX52221.1 tRNA (guanosine(37)-N1)-methyltransferase TrmD [Chloroflexota bacterium]MXX83320.1 tRNA (guanosine(37)-N1)-methyltransferase TrmD [Chloroflexota bacterium]
MQIDALSLFPAMFASVMSASMMWKAQDRGLLSFRAHDIRDYATDKHRQVDDTPYGGGGGMILKPDVLVRAIEALRPARETPAILLSPQGRLLTHQVAAELAHLPRLVLVCGHYEGIDERVRQLAITDEISIGDYVLTGGELAALVLIDAVVRLVPGVLGAAGATDRDSHAHGLLEGAHYTRPAVFRGLPVPAILTSGHHAEVARWRRQQALLRTWQRRPDLLEKAQLSAEDREWLRGQGHTPLGPPDRPGGS